MESTDILILGGGPSGLSTALHLQQLAPLLARRMLVLEKARYPRPKLCAGGLVADAEIILQRLGLDVSEVPHVDALAAHLDFAGRGLRVRLPNAYAIRIIRRDEFDRWLAEKARSRGIEIREGITVRNVQPREDCVLVETNIGTLRAQIVVGADGSNGVTRRCILPNESVHTARVLEVLTPEHNLTNNEAKHTPRNDMHRADVAYFDFFPVPAGIAGYTWDFPTQVGGEPMRCWGVYDTNLLASMRRPALKEPLAEEMARQGFDLEQVKLQGHPIRWFSPFAQFSTPRVILAGDAAGADPLFGEGISLALGYGQFAAREIVRAFERNDFSFNGYKHRLMRSALGRALTARWGITQIVYRLRWDWFQRNFWRRMGWVIGPVAWLFVVNWAKRTRRSSSPNRFEKTRSI